MKVIFDTLAQAGREIDQYYEAQRNRLQYQQRIQATKRIASLVQRLEHILAILETIQQQGVHMQVGMPLEQRNAVLGLLRDYYEKIETMSMQPDDVKVLESVIDTVLAHYTGLWQMTAHALAGELPNSLLLISSLLDNPADAQALKQVIERYISQFPQQPADVAGFLAGIRQGGQTIQAMQVDDRIRDFLAKLTSRRATIADLNQHVMQWIKERKLEERLAIGFAKS